MEATASTLSVTGPPYLEAGRARLLGTRCRRLPAPARRAALVGVALRSEGPGRRSHYPLAHGSGPRPRGLRRRVPRSRAGVCKQSSDVPAHLRRRHPHAPAADRTPAAFDVTLVTQDPDRRASCSTAPSSLAGFECARRRGAPPAIWASGKPRLGVWCPSGRTTSGVERSSADTAPRCVQWWPRRPLGSSTSRTPGGPLRPGAVDARGVCPPQLRAPDRSPHRGDRERSPRCVPAFEWRKIRYEEQQAWKSMGLCLAVSDVDAVAFREVEPDEWSCAPTAPTRSSACLVRAARQAIRSGSSSVGTASYQPTSGGVLVRPRGHSWCAGTRTDDVPGGRFAAGPALRRSTRRLRRRAASVAPYLLRGGRRPGLPGLRHAVEGARGNGLRASGGPHAARRRRTTGASSPEHFDAAHERVRAPFWPSIIEQLVEVTARSCGA